MNFAYKHSINLSTKGYTYKKFKFQLIYITIDFYKSNQDFFSVPYLYNNIPKNNYLQILYLDNSITDILIILYV